MKINDYRFYLADVKNHVLLTDEAFDTVEEIRQYAIDNNIIPVNGIVFILGSKLRNYTWSHNLISQGETI
jgi:hypothetical protein